MLTNLVVAAVVSAATWQPLPPNGSSNIQSLYSRGDTLIACGGSGCSFTADGGSTWSRPSGALPFSSFSSPSGGRMLANVEGRALLSTDLGRTWIGWNEGIPSDRFLEKISLRGDVAFASASKVRRSIGMIDFPTDTCSWYVRSGSATSWALLSSASTGYCGDIAIGSGGTFFRTIDTTFGVSSTTIVQSSVDAGRTWRLVQPNAWLREYTPSIFAITPISSDSVRLSTDSGATFAAPIPGTIPSYGILDGAYLSGPTTWRDLRTDAIRTITLDSILNVRAWVRTGSRLWANGDYGLFASSDSGRTWTRADATFPLGQVGALRWHDGALYAVLQSYRRQRFARSTDAGTSWTQVFAGLLSTGNMEECAEGLMLPEKSSTILVDVSGPRALATSSNNAKSIACSGSRTLGLSSGGLVGWTGSGWTLESDPVGSPLQIAATPAGLFTKQEASIAGEYRMILGFNALGATKMDTAILPSSAYVKSVAGSVRGAWVSTMRGLYLCSGATDCQAIRPAGTDSLWAFLSTSVQGRFVLASALPYSQDLAYDFVHPKLFASSDSGRTWTGIDVPSVAKNAAVTPSGIVANLLDGGLWRLESDIFREVGVQSRASRVQGPSLRAVGRNLTLTGVVSGARLRVLDASGRTLLDLRPDVVAGTSRIALPATARGVLFADVQSAGVRTGFQWVATDR